MKPWALLLVLLATPLSSPLGCGGDGCLRNSDCAADESCSAGSCVAETPAPAAIGGETNEAGEAATPNAGTSSGSGGAQAGTAGSSAAGSTFAGAGGGESGAGQGGASEGGAAGALTDPIDEGGAGFGGALDFGGAGLGGALDFGGAGLGGAL
jgi:hypothetical protein